MRTTQDPFEGISSGEVLLYGGTFDPPTVAHERLPALVSQQINARRLLYIPAARSPFKEQSPTVSDEHRLQMLKFLDPVSHGAGDAQLLTHELDTLSSVGGAPSFTVDTLTQLRASSPRSVHLRLLIGEDQARSFHRWRAASTILDLAQPAVMRRDTSDSGSDLLEHLSGHWASADLRMWEAAMVPVPPMKASSTAVRDLLSTDPGHPSLRELVPDAVLRYIQNNGLYA